MALACLNDYEQRAASILPKNAFDYYRSGAGEEFTLQLNREAFQRLRIRPRILRDVSKLDPSTTVLGSKVSLPIGIAPTAMQRMAHPEGECATARAAGVVNTIYTLSTLSTSSLEQVASVASDTLKWFQLYIYKDRKLTQQLVERAERAGFKALVLTVDAPVFGIRNADTRNKFELPSHLRLANFNEENTTVVKKTDGSAINQYVATLFDQSISWEDVKWLKRITKLPLVLKGILTVEDAIKGADIGAAAIQVSNHGGRQLDGAPSPIEVLPEIVRAVGSRCEVYLDGGVRQGTDVFKALALGARMVFLGRPIVYGLAVDGEKGVVDLLNLIKREFVHALALSGCTSVADIKTDMVVHQSSYSKL